MIDTKIFYFGSLCKNGHNYEGSMVQSLRYRSTRQCVECHKSSYQDNKVERNRISRKHFQDNKVERNEKKKLYNKIKRKTDIRYHLIETARNMMHRMKKGFKSVHTFELFDCTADFWRKHLESTWYGDMRWENHGTYWEVDHIIPLCSFDLEDIEQQKKAFHWSNTQALTIEDHRKKTTGDRKLSIRNK